MFETGEAREITVRDFRDTTQSVSDMPDSARSSLRQVAGFQVGFLRRGQDE
jgi:hypothetical protein